MTNPETIRPITEGDQPILPPTICHLIDDKLLEAESVTERVALAGEPGMEDALLTCPFKNARRRLRRARHPAGRSGGPGHSTAGATT